MNTDIKEHAGVVDVIAGKISAIAGISLAVASTIVLSMVCAPALVTHSLDEAATIVAPEQDAKPKRKTLVGTVKSVEIGEETGAPASLELKTKHKVEVDLTDLVQCYKHEAVPLQKVTSRAQAYLLARKQEKTFDPETQRYFPAQYVSITAFVVEGRGASWSPPKLTEKQEKAKLRWHKGPLYNGEHASTLNGINIQFGRTRKVVVVEKAEPKEIKKRLPIQVTGTVDDLKKPKTMKALQLTILTKQIPKREYQPVIGLSN